MAPRFTWPLAAVALFATAAVAHAQAEPPTGRVSYEGSVVVRVTVSTVRQYHAAMALTDDLWSHGAGIGSFDMRVTPAQRAGLDAAGIPYTVLIPDLQARISAETARLEAANSAEGGVSGEDWFADFKSLAQINARMDELAAAHPELVTVLPVGMSYENRPIKALRIGRAGQPNAPAFLFNACQHAREWATPMTAMYLAQRLIDGNLSDPRLASILDRAAVIIVPVVNTDGYEYSWTTVRLWRKNRQPNGDGSFGTDTNRNWGFQWGGEGASATPSSETYRGAEPFSSPEAAAMRDFFTAHQEIVASLDIHSYGQQIMWPWAYAADLCPDDPLHRAVGLSIQFATLQVDNRSYESGPIYTTIYPASGGAVDWTYGDQGSMSFTTEVRDTGEYGFVMPPEEIIPNAVEQYAGALALIEGILGPAVVLPNGEMPSSVQSGEPTLVSVLVTGTAGPVQNVNLRCRVGGGEFQSIYMQGSGDVFTAALPPIPCGMTVEYWFEALGPGGQSTLPAGAPATVFSARSQLGLSFYSDAMENGPAGWTVGAPGDNATSGTWVNGDPVGTNAQPENDHTLGGTRCWVTGQGNPGGAAGTADVDGGVTTVVSPPLPGSQLLAELSYWYWYSNDLGADPENDSMLVEYSTDNTNWALLEEISQSTNAWAERRVVLNTFLTAPGDFRIRFRARDLSAGSLIEAAIDDVSVSFSGCPFAAGDFNNDGIVDGADLGVLLGEWSKGGSIADLNVDGIVDGADLGLLLGMWG